jgi:hypothetical protein
LGRGRRGGAAWFKLKLSNVNILWDQAVNKTASVLLPFRATSDAIEISLADGVWRTVDLQGQGGDLASALHSVRACAFWPELGGVLLANPDGRAVRFWCFDSALTLTGELSASSSGDGLRAELASFATAFMCALYRNPLQEPEGSLLADLKGLGPEVLAPLIALSAPPTVQPLSEAGRLPLTTGDGSREASLAEVARQLLIPSPDRDERTYVWLAPAAERGRVTLRSLCSAGVTTDVYYVGRWGNSPSYYCRESDVNLVYYLVQRHHAPSLLFFPDDNLLVSKDRTGVEQWEVAEAMQILARQVASLAACRPRDVAPPKDVALLTYGVRHVGHAIWDEMSALDAFLDRRNPDLRPPHLYRTSVTGVDFYGPVNVLYPEFSGRIREAGSEADLAAHAMENGVQIVPISGHVVLHSTRRRMQRVIAEHGRVRRLEARAQSAAERGPIIVLQIRLTNRCPEDSVEVYGRLLRKLAEQSGPLTVVIDGINGTGRPGEPAGPVYNGVAAVDTSKLTSGSEELRAEEAWAQALESSLEGAPIQIVNCIGWPIMDNMFWLSKADFFIAPIGAGLAKLRWALDIPGFVVTSQANARSYYAINIFADEAHMEPPFSKISYSGHEDVVDLPLSPPRSGPPPLAWGIPHPDNFRIHEDRLFPAVADALTVVLASRRKGPDQPQPPISGKTGWMDILTRWRQSPPNPRSSLTPLPR